MSAGFRVLVAVRPEGLSRIIFHLLANIGGIDVVCSITDSSRLVRYTQRVLPHVIILNTRFVSADPAVVGALRAASPGVRLLLTTREDSPSPIPRARQSRFDAQISEASLVTKLIPTVRKLCSTAGTGVSRRTPRRRIP